ncbi:MAG: hypothetical protein KDB26_11125 [Microthrixaceae bacterium]|nr:hypothetical protein [Microthrixaceae bacterium]
MSINISFDDPHTRPAARSHRWRPTCLALLVMLVAVVGLVAPTASAGAATGNQNAVAPINPEIASAVAGRAAVFPGSVGASGPVFDDGAVVSLVTPRATLSGRTVLGDNWEDAIRAGRRAKPVDGFHDVVAHGTPTGIYDDVGNLLSPSEAAAAIRSTPSWAGQDIRLLSCSTGCPTGRFTQALADELGVAVRAPTVDFYVNSRGVPVLDAGGRWITYSPGGG